MSHFIGCVYTAWEPARTHPTGFLQFSSCPDRSAGLITGGHYARLARYSGNVGAPFSRRIVSRQDQTARTNCTPAGCPLNQLLTSRGRGRGCLGRTGSDAASEAMPGWRVAVPRGGRHLNQRPVDVPWSWPDDAVGRRRSVKSQLFGAWHRAVFVLT